MTAGDAICLRCRATIRPRLVAHLRYVLPLVQTLLLCLLVARGGDLEDHADGAAFQVSYLPGLVARFLSARLTVVPAFAWICLATASLWYWIGRLIDGCLPATIQPGARLPARAWLAFAATAAVWSVSVTDPAGFILFASTLLTVIAFYRLRRRAARGAVVTMDVPPPLFQTTAPSLQTLFDGIRTTARGWRHRLGVRHYVTATLVVWALAAMLAQSPGALGTLLLVNLVGWLALYWIFPGVHRWRWLVLGLGLMVSVLSWVGTLQGSSVGRDFAALIVAAGLAALFSRSELCRRMEWQQTACFALLVCLGWLFWSAGDFVAGRRTPPLNPNRFSSLPDRYPGIRIAAALSGGGYRAALVHAGALSALEKMGIRVSNLSTVSGGSIIGSFYTLGGTPEDFLKIVSSQDVNLKREALDAQNLLRLALPLDLPGTTRPGSDDPVTLLPARWRFTTTDLHAEFLDRHFLAGRRLRDRGPGAPGLMIVATDLGKGQLVGIGRDFVLSYSALSTATYGALSFRSSSVNTVNVALIDNSDRDLAAFVAGSAAFPVVFQPKEVVLRNGERLRLADGGLIDNSGAELLYKIKAQSWEPRQLAALLGAAADEIRRAKDDLLGTKDDDIRLIIAIDAGDNFEAGAAMPSWQRATAIMSQQVGTVERVKRAQLAEEHTVTLSPADYFDNARPNAPLALVEDESPPQARRFDPERWSFAAPGDDDKIILQDLEMLVVGDSAGAGLPQLQSDLFVRDFWQQWPGVFASIDFSDLSRPGARTFSSAAWSRVAGWIKVMQTTDTAYDDLVARRKAAEGLAKFIIEDFSRCLGTFRRTATLRDNVPRDDALQLFRLGTYLALFGRAGMETVIVQKYPGAVNAARVRILTPRQQTFLQCILEISPGGSGNLAGKRAWCSKEYATAEQARRGEEPH